MKAFMLQTVKAGSSTYLASTSKTPSIVDLTKAQFDRLEANGAVREPTEDELKIAGLNEPAAIPAPATKVVTKAEQKKIDAAAAQAATDAAAAQAVTDAAAAEQKKIDDAAAQAVSDAAAAQVVIDDAAAAAAASDADLGV